MKYEEAMAKDPIGWGKAGEKEHEHMKEHEVFKVVKMKNVPKGAKIHTATWAMKQKANDTLRARLNAQGFQQESGEHYKETGISSPVVNEAMIFIILMFACMARWCMELNDVHGAFLNGVFSFGEQLFMWVSKNLNNIIQVT